LIVSKIDQKVNQFYFNEQILHERARQTIAGELIANGIKKFGISRKLHQARGLFCAKGRCYSSFVTVDGLDHVLSCMTLVEEGMNVRSKLSDPDVGEARS